MDSSSNLAMMASLDDVAAACAAAMTRPAFGFRAAQHDRNARIFQSLSHAHAPKGMQTGIIEAICRERSGTWRFKSRCPYCGDTHMHGGGARPVPSFGARDADCGGGGYAALAVAAEVST